MKIDEIDVKDPIKGSNKQKPIEKTNSKTFGKLNRYKQYFPSLFSIILLIALGQILSPGFAHIGNIFNILTISTILAMAAIGQTLIILSGKEGIDLSIGAVMSMGALLGAQYSGGNNSGIFYAVIMLIGLGLIIGLINGLGIQLLDIPPLVMTLGMASVVNGFALAATKGMPVGGAPEFLIQIGSERLWNVRWLLIIGILLIIIIELVLRKTSYGKRLYLVGSNRNASMLAGIKVNKTVILTYIIAGIVGSLAGFILLGYAGTAQLEIANDYQLLSIAAVVIGGTALTGGKGNYIGSALGAVVLTLLTSVLTAVGMPAGVREMIQGIILLLIVLIYSRAPKLRL